MTVSKTRIAVLVSGGGTNLQALIDAQASGIIHSGEIVLVVSNKSDAFALERARVAGIDTAVVLKSDCAGQDEFEQRIIDQLSVHNVQLIVLAGFMSILTEKFTSLYPERILNVHPSLIPKFCGKGFYGLKVHEAVLAAGEKVSGATVHFVNEIPDGGRILFQKEVAVDKGDTPESLQRRVMEQAEWIILPQAVEHVSEILANGSSK